MLYGFNAGGLALDATKKTRSQERRDSRKEREAFEKVRNAESAYATQLRRLAKHIQDIVAGIHDPLNPSEVELIERVLKDYSATIKPWAKVVAKRMLDDVRRRDERAWNKFTKSMSEGIRKEILSAPTGELHRKLMGEQVDLITSLPLDAAQRVHEIATGQLYTGARSSELRDQILRTGLVTRSRATLIARTETARAASHFTQARARHIGADQYIWRTSLDPEVRPATWLPQKTFQKLNKPSMGSHRLLEGKVFSWAKPPIIGTNGERGSPGTIYNCRCWAEPIIPDKYR